MERKISIIVPVYNVAGYLKESIESIIKQHPLHTPESTYIIVSSYPYNFISFQKTEKTKTNLDNIEIQSISIFATKIVQAQRRNKFD